MPRPRTYRRTFVMRWTLVEEAIVGTYAERFGWDQSAVVRSMIRKFGRADTEFDVKRFKRIFGELLKEQMGDDPEGAAEAKRLCEKFLGEVGHSSA